MMDVDLPQKRRRGGQPKVDPDMVLGSAEALRRQFAYAWPSLGKRLLAANSAAEVWEIVKSGKGIISNSDMAFSELLFEVLREPTFPRFRTKSQLTFLADSLGASGVVTPRRSRDICSAQRRKVRHMIVRQDFYIECTCGYEGPAKFGKCPKCKTGELSDELRRRELES